ncbi:nuclear transport factor 2 family protein [soil metagenome]
MHANEALLEKFYSAFQRLDAETMASCYTEDVQFSDPVFPNLQGREATDMWRMLTTKAQDFSLVFDGIRADDQKGEAHWVASYTFSQTGRVIVNDIHATFSFRNGRIVRHRDQFNLWKWARQGLGMQGLLLGWTPMLKHKIQAQAAKGLAVFRGKRG